MVKPLVKRAFLMALTGSLLLSVAFDDARCDEEEDHLSEPASCSRNPAPFDIPPYRGERYEDLVPDTLDLAVMAESALNGLTRPLDSEEDLLLYFTVDWFRNPPVMRHEHPSDLCQAKFMGPTVLCRLISGSALNLDRERALIERYLGDLEGHVLHADGGSSRIWEAMMIYHLRDGDDLWKNIVLEAARNMIREMIDKGDWAYFGPEEEAPKGYDAADGWRAEAFMRIYRTFEYEPALEWGGKYVRFLKDHSGNFSEDGRFIGHRPKPGYQDVGGGHFHNHTVCLIAILDYALLTDDEDLLDFVKKSYDWAKSSEAYSSSLLGFFPEFSGEDFANSDGFNSEGCPIADMLTLALMFSASEAEDCWDDADRWLRNHFAEIQLTRPRGAHLERLARSMPTRPVEDFETAEKVTERNIGAFAGWPSINEWADETGIQHCCTGNCARTLYYGWRNILHLEGRELRVNLLLNRASPWADIYSHIPYEGRVVLKIQKPCSPVLVRVPEWIETNSREVACSVNGKPRKVRWEKRYVHLGNARKGDVIIVRFPISEREVSEKIGGTEYTFVVKGSTVVYVDPPGRSSPLYLRNHYRQDRTRWRKVTRFVSHEHVDW